MTPLPAYVCSSDTPKDDRVDQNGPKHSVSMSRATWRATRTDHPLPLYSCQPRRKSGNGSGLQLDQQRAEQSLTVQCGLLPMVNYMCALDRHRDQLLTRRHDGTVTVFSGCFMPPRHGFHPSRDEASRGCHRPRQSRTPQGSQLSQGTPRRPHQPVLAAAGYNFGLLLRWHAELLRIITRTFVETVAAQNIA